MCEKYHYTYILIHNTEELYYIGCRTSKVPPNEDTAYMSSSNVIKGLDFKNFDKIVLDEFPAREDTISEEIRLHDLHDVARNAYFVNKAKQTSVAFDTTGMSFKKSAEAIQKIVEFHTGRKRSAETQAKVSKALKGRAGNKDFRYSKETIEVLRNLTSKRKVSDTTKKKISKALKGTKLGVSNPAARAVRCIELDKRFSTITEVTQFIGLKSLSSINNMLPASTKKAGGYVWEYI